jgi:hypothetical protein
MEVDMSILLNPNSGVLYRNVHMYGATASKTRRVSSPAFARAASILSMEGGEILARAEAWDLAWALDEHMKTVGTCHEYSEVMATIFKVLGSEDDFDCNG